MNAAISAFLEDLQVAVAFLTRVPMPHPSGPVPQNFARAHRVFPVVGGLIGAAVGLVYLALTALGIPSLAAAALALGAGMLLTGALHEDGLADVADGFGGGHDRAEKLEIMRDSRLGTYGALVLLVAFVAKTAAIAAMPGGDVIAALVVVHATARSVLPLMAIMMPHARADGLAATAGRPEPSTAVVALVLALIIAVIFLPFLAVWGTAVVAAASAAMVVTLAQRQIGGQTGDVLGCAEQVTETTVLLFLAAHMT
jgi:adenosylcobinamide-GDP ribazoletransferase